MKHAANKENVHNQEKEYVEIQKRVRRAFDSVAELVKKDLQSQSMNRSHQSSAKKHLNSSKLSF